MLRAHCENEGTDYDRIEKTVQGGPTDGVADPDGFFRLAEQLTALGIEHIHLRTRTDDPAGYVARFGELVAPRFADIR